MSESMETKKWYVLHALSGQENKALENLHTRIPLEEMQEYIEDVQIPTEKVSEVKNGKKTTVTRKLFPGYILIKMSVYDSEDRTKKEKLDKPWTFIQATPGLIGFIGGEKPVALQPEEARQMMNQIKDSADVVKSKVVYEPGEQVKVVDGAFQGQSGTVEEVDPERGRLKVSISIFGQEVGLDLEYWQVERGE